MIRRLSVLATFLLLAILQVCAAFGPPVGRFKLSIRNMYLDVEDNFPGSPVILNPGTTFTMWKLSSDGSIMHFRSGLFLSYEKEQQNARLILAYKPVKWRAETLETGLQISAPDCHLVVGLLPITIYPPFVGLTKQDKEGSQAWKLERFGELDPTPHVQQATYEFLLDDGLLGPHNPEPSSPVYLLPRPTQFTVWKLLKRGPDIYLIQNYATGLFLSYDPHNLEEPLKISSEPSPFHLSRIDRNFIRILADIPGTELAVAKLAPEEPNCPPKIGLVDVHKVPDQKWLIRITPELDDSPRQHRLPFRRLRFW